MQTIADSYQSRKRMDFIKLAISKPVSVSVAVLLVVLFGLLALKRIPVQLTPNIDSTVVAITTHWEGASPQEIENDILREQEEKVKGAAGLQKMTSVATQNEGVIRLEFALGTPKEVALREVSDKLREVPSYPENVDEPVVEGSDPDNRDYIAWVVIRCLDEGYDVRQMQDFIEDRVKPELERVPGVSEVNVLGGLEREAQVQVDPVKLAQKGITVPALLAKLRAQNQDASAGRLQDGKYDVRVRAVGRFDDPIKIEKTLLSDPGQPVVRVEDVAKVVVGYKEVERMVRSRGHTVIAINAQREPGSNVMQVMAGFRDVIDKVNTDVLPAEAQRLGLEKGFEIEQVYDQTIYIQQAVDLVMQNLWVGGTLAVLVLLAFLRSIRSTLIIAVAIPVSVIGTFLAMVMMGRSLNVISLAGLAFAVGMVVDNAIVVLENIDRHRRLGEKVHMAAYKATKEVWGAVLASTLTTVAVFLPVLFLEEEAGQLFRDIALAVVASVSLSMVVSITVIPTAANFLLKKGKQKAPAKQSKAVESVPEAKAKAGKKKGRSAKALVRGAMAVPSKIVDGFGKLIYALSGSWIARILLVTVMTVASLLGAMWLMPPTSYLPSGNQNLVFAVMNEPPGYSVDQRMMIGDRIEAHVAPYYEAGLLEKQGLGKVDPKDLPPAMAFNMQTMEAYPVDVPPLDNFFFVAMPNMMFMGARSVDEGNVQPAAALLNNAIQGQPGINGFAFQMPLFRTGARSQAGGIELEISGPDLDQVAQIAQALMGQLIGKYGPMAVQPTPTNFNLPGQELRIALKAVEASDLGITQAQLNQAVQVFGDGAYIGDYLTEDDTIDLKVMALANAPRQVAGQAQGASASFDGPMSDNVDLTQLIDWPIYAGQGRVVPLASVAEAEMTVSPTEINRIEEQRSVVLSINLPDDAPLEEAMEEVGGMIQAMRDGGQIPPSVRTAMAGSAAKLQAVKNAMLGEWTGFNAESFVSLFNSRMFLALLVVYLLMAALFENWVYPLVIMFSVPLATVGGFAGLRLVHESVPTQQLDILTMLGFVILIGVVVNNAILIVHQSLNLMRGEAEIEHEGQVIEKLPPREAIAEAVKSRVRPIFMTTLTSVGGMLPLVLFPGSGSELYRGLGSVVVGGLVVSTVFTLLLVPMVMSMAMDLLGLLAKVTGKQDAQTA